MKKPKVSDDAIYAAVASRRAGFDNMVWQVPIISLTAQAFLFTIALGPESSAHARYTAAGLAFVVTVLSLILMARHRQADITDGVWLADAERRRFREDSMEIAHSEPWRLRRNETDIWEHTPVNWAKTWPAFRIWEVGLSLFGLAAIGIILVTAIWPWLLDSAPTIEVNVNQLRAGILT